MLHARRDYDRFQDPENKIPLDMPVFLLVGNDFFAGFAVEFYGAALAGDWERAEKALDGARTMYEKYGGNKEMGGISLDWSTTMKTAATKVPDL